MKNFGLVVIGAHTGVWLANLLEKYKEQNILLVEPVPYNVSALRNNTSQYKNLAIETSVISSKNQKQNFYFVKLASVENLGKHWASGIGSFDKEHILNHRYKRFKIQNSDIEKIEISNLTFGDLVIKYSIGSIDMLQIDVEGAEFEIMNSINFEEISIKKIFFEFKHFDGTFNKGPKFKLIKERLINSNYSILEVDNENILAEKKTSFDLESKIKYPS